jgi:beta-xylosidase
VGTRLKRRASRVAVVVVVFVVSATLAVAAWGLSPDSRSAASQATVLARADPAAPAVIITPGVDAPTPFVLVDGGRYYLYASQSIFPTIVPVGHGAVFVYAPQIQVRESSDRIHWQVLKDALPKLPAWAAGVTWAPAVRRFGNRYVMYFTARASQVPVATQCIGAATSKTPRGPFHPLPKPFVCQLEHRGSIDPRVFEDKDGTLWLDWKSDDNADIHGDAHSWIYAQRLGADGLHLLGKAKPILTADQRWEGRIVESPQMVRALGTYWLFYSGNWFNQPSYAIGVAKCKGPAGPCTKPWDRPFLASNAQGAGPGEGALFSDRDGMWMVYGPQSVRYQTPTVRSVALVHLGFVAFGPYLTKFPETARTQHVVPAQR